MNTVINKNLFLYSTATWLLLLQGIFNYLLGSGLGAAWKQIVVVLIYAGALFFLKSKKILNYVTIITITAALLILYGLLKGIPIENLAFNIFFYLSWIPFFFFAQKGFGVLFIRRFRGYLFVFLVASTIGMYLDLTTDYFSFLIGRDYDNSYLEQLGTAKRAAFIFNTSTTVLPIMGGVAALIFMEQRKETELFVIAICLAISAYCTGSSSATIMLLFFTVGALYVSKAKATSKVLFLAFVFVLAIIFLANYSGGLLQVDRVLGNGVQSDSNQGRLYLWSYALNQLSEFSFTELLLGKGIGVTNSRFDVDATYMHGESSYFQALIEGGIIGTLIRVIPFFLYYLYFRHTLLTTLYITGLLIATAVAPIFGNIALQAIIGTIVGSCAHIKKRKNSVI